LQNVLAAQRGGSTGLNQEDSANVHGINDVQKYTNGVLQAANSILQQHQTSGASGDSFTNNVRTYRSAPEINAE
jgi:hypothetical protein